MQLAASTAESTMQVVGVISDTHGLLRPEAAAALAGSDVIVHAGDIGKPEVLAALQTLAPRVVAIRGNVDLRWAHDFDDVADVTISGRRLHVLHDLKQLAIDPSACGVDVVVSGHSHRPLLERRGGVLYLNPGSAGPRRFRLPVTLARLRLAEARDIEAEIVSLLP
jgi:phosphoesterase, MJ0936 family